MVVDVHQRTGTSSLLLKVAIMLFGIAWLLAVALVGLPPADVGDRDTRAVPSGFWGSPTALHQFCEPKYATTPYVAEFYNSLSSFVYVIFAIYMFSRPEIRKDPMLVLSVAAVAVIGLGSVVFHGTMLFEYELCDEVPMLIFISIALYNKAGAHPLLMTRRRCILFVALVTLLCAGIIYLYAKMQIYELFVGGFTLMVILDVAFALTWHSKQRVTTWAMYMSIGCISLGKVFWEVEVRMCSRDSRVWPLHVVWHFLSCGCTYYGLLADMASRIDCGLSFSNEDAVPIDWVGVPFTEIKVMKAPIHDRSR